MKLQVFLEQDEPRVLPVPYHTPGEPRRRFWNVKRDERLIGHISELRGCPELRTLVRRLNRADSGFATLGCAHWTKTVDYGTRATHEAGLYVDIVFDRLGPARSRKRYLELVGRLRDRGTDPREKDRGLPLLVIRLQPQRVWFAKLGSTAWMLSVWVFGAGDSKSAAIARRRRGVEVVGKVCDAVSADLEAKAGRPGIAIPP